MAFIIDIDNAFAEDVCEEPAALQAERQGAEHCRRAIRAHRARDSNKALILRSREPTKVVTRLAVSCPRWMPMMMGGTLLDTPTTTISTTMVLNPIFQSRTVSASPVMTRNRTPMMMRSHSSDFTIEIISICCASARCPGAEASAFSLLFIPENSIRTLLIGRNLVSSRFCLALSRTPHKMKNTRNAIMNALEVSLTGVLRLYASTMVGIAVQPPTMMHSEMKNFGL